MGRNLIVQEIEESLSFSLLVLEVCSQQFKLEPFRKLIEVIRGWDIGVKSMKKGEKSNFEIPSDYAYGSSEIPGLIPANSTLMFEVELLSWK